MIFRFECLAVGDKAYELWAHSLEEAREKVKAQTGLSELDFDVFWYGGMPKHLSWDEYKLARGMELNLRQIQEYDQRIGRLLGEVT